VFTLGNKQMVLVVFLVWARNNPTTKESGDLKEGGQELQFDTDIEASGFRY